MRPAPAAKSASRTASSAPGGQKTTSFRFTRFPSLPGGNDAAMATITVQPRPTPEERQDVPVEVEVDEALTVFAQTVEDWVAPRQEWEFTLHEGTDFGRANNVEGRLLFVSGTQTSTVRFRLDQLDGADDMQDELVLRFEEKDGIAKAVRCTSTGLDVELFHILT